MYTSSPIPVECEIQCLVQSLTIHSIALEKNDHFEVKSATTSPAVLAEKEKLTWTGTLRAMEAVVICDANIIVQFSMFYM